MSCSPGRYDVVPVSSSCFEIVSAIEVDSTLLSTIWILAVLVDALFMYVVVDLTTTAAIPHACVVSVSSNSIEQIRVVAILGAINL